MQKFPEREINSTLCMRGIVQFSYWQKYLSIKLLQLFTACSWQGINYYFFPKIYTMLADTRDDRANEFITMDHGHFTAFTNILLAFLYFLYSVALLPTTYSFKKFPFEQKYWDIEDAIEDTRTTANSFFFFNYRIMFTKTQLRN